MKRYSIKSDANHLAYFDITEEQEDGYRIRITRIIDGYEKVTNDFMGNSLFDMCIKTGYIHEMAEEGLTGSSVA